MTAPVRYGTTTTRLVHRVHVRHAVTGAPLAVAARLDPTPYGWWVRARGADVVVVARDGVPAPAVPPTLTLTVADARTVLRLTQYVFEVPLTAPEITVDALPAEATLTVELLTPGTGTPRGGRTVVARATRPDAGSPGDAPLPVFDLPETDPGLYRSDPVTWTAAFVPLDLLVDGDLLTRTTVDVTRLETRIRLTDTT